VSLCHGSDEDFDPAVFDADFVGFDVSGGAVEAVAGAQIKTPAVPVAFDEGVAQIAVGERRAPVRTEIFDGVELARNVVEGEFLSAVEFDGCAASRRHVFRAPDGDERAGAHWSFEVWRFGVKGLHEI